MVAQTTKPASPELVDQYLEMAHGAYRQHWAALTYASELPVYDERDTRQRSALWLADHTFGMFTECVEAARTASALRFEGEGS